VKRGGSPPPWGSKKRRKKTGRIRWDLADPKKGGKDDDKVLKGGGEGVISPQTGEQKR